MPKSIHTPPEKETGRLEAFSDGVFAIAITLLVLDLKVPPRGQIAPHGLAQALLAQWPIYLAYVTSFLTILIMWVNHHRLFRHVTRIDHWFLILNGLLLMVVTLVPFPTSLLAEYIRSADAPLAAGIYSGLCLLMAVLYNVLWRYATDSGRLIGPNENAAEIDTITRQYRFGPLAYVAAFILSLVWMPAGVGLDLLLALFFALPGTTQMRE